MIVQQLYREMLSIADEMGGKLPNRVMFFLDEFGTLPAIQSAEMMFSASRSRRISFVPIIQSLAQLEKNYGKEGADIIIDNCQVCIYGGFAPNSEAANVLSKTLGDRTVMTGSISQGRDKSKSLQMTGRPLMTPDELKIMPKDTFIVTRTGVKPMKTKLKLFFEWGIELNETYPMRQAVVRKVHSNVYRVTDYLHPFDGYNCQPVICFDEFRSSIKLKEMLLYCDIYPLELPSRFSNKYACYNKVYIVSNWSLEKQYHEIQREDMESWKAFLRRIHKVIVYDKNGSVTEYKSVQEYQDRNEFMKVEDMDDIPFL